MGMDIDRLPLLQYNLNAPDTYISPTNHEVNEIIREDLLQMHTFKTWLALSEHPMKLKHHSHCLQISIIIVQ